MQEKVEQYKQEALKARLKVLEMIYNAQTSHIGPNFSCIDVLSVLYNIANVDKDLKEDRDRIVVSKGWVAASVYYFLAEKGIIQEKDLETYCQEGSEFIGLVEPVIRGVEAAGGSMGFGLPFSVGFALAKKTKQEKGRVFVLMGDGEVAIGTTWESALIASHHKLDNLVVVIDANKFQAMGEVKDVLNIEPLKDKWLALGWNVEEINGHNFEEIENAFLNAEKIKEKPTVVIARTIKGKGVSFMEDNNLYHYKALSEKEYNQAKEELLVNNK